MLFRGEKVVQKVGVGAFFYCEGRNEVYMLAEVNDGKVAMVCLNDGYRWDDPVEVEDVDFLTREEFAVAAGGMFGGLEVISRADVSKYIA